MTDSSRYNSPDEQAIATNDNGADESVKPTFKPIRLVLFVLFIIIALSQFVQWYSLNVSLPRYCENPEQTLYYLEKTITEKTPAGEQSRRPYLIAAKLVYLVPQHSNEPLDVYLDRVRKHIFRICHP